MAKKPSNPFVEKPDHMGEMTVRMLTEIVQDKSEFPRGLETVIRIGDVEGNHGVNGQVTVMSHRPEDVVLAIDPNAGDPDYDYGGEV